MCNHVHVYIANMKTMAKILKCSQIQSQSIYFSKISWGGMPPDPPSISMLRMLIVLRTIMNTQD